MLKQRVEEAVSRLKARLEELAEGYVEVSDVDEERGDVRLILVGGRMC